MIPFNRASFDGKELSYLATAVEGGHTAGNGPFTKQAERMLSAMHGGAATLLTTSCTHALELSARLLDLQPGDEVIVPAYTFVTTASAYAWNGARPVFADIRPDTMNIDVDDARGLVTERTKAICIVHYAGIGAEPDAFAQLADDHGIALIEDNAHGLGARYGGQTLGSFGAMSTLSFHETKNITCGEGGALVINDPALLERAEILREKGTDRSRFLRGQVDKYTWVDLGSSWVLSDLLAGVLVGQLERFAEIQAARMRIWERYADELRGWAAANDVRLPAITPSAEHPAHMFFLVLPDDTARDRYIQHMQRHGVMSVFHYQDLATSAMAERLGSVRECPNAQAAAGRLVRLPLFASLSTDEQSQVIEATLGFAR
ncbi:MAG: dTDP-4-amino-4,6-dideoxygalactose transaminase [Actinomycetales bacterium]|nr:dTDP-4-amino-4,6-dideoxygalactose transaminase [Actinomycetales bacterium]